MKAASGRKTLWLGSLYWRPRQDSSHCLRAIFAWLAGLLAGNPLWDDAVPTGKWERTCTLAGQRCADPPPVPGKEQPRALRVAWRWTAPLPCA